MPQVIAQDIVGVQPMQQVFPPYHVINERTMADKVVIDVVTEVADWIWQQDSADWTTANGDPNYIYSRFVISQDLMLLLALQWPQ